MTRYAFLVALPALAALAGASTAKAQCTGGEAFCADIQIGGGVHFGGHVRVGPPPPPPRGQVIVVTPAPPPPPQVVYVQPAPPPVVYVQPAPPPPPQQVVIVRPAPPVATVYAPPPGPTQTSVLRGGAIHGRIGGAASDDFLVSGGTLAFRYRPNLGFFATELGVGLYGGIDANDFAFAEVPLTANAMFFLNPGSPLQVYTTAGLGVSFSHHEEDVGVLTVVPRERNYVRIGGELGVGLELKLSNHWAVSADVRGFIRQRVGGDNGPEFVAPDGRTTDTSGGWLGTLGATLYY